MSEKLDDRNGFVYILEVKDIDLPVCKIGMTTRDPHARCAEINTSSTGDFLWEVSSYFYVNDCKAFESLVHKKLEPLRQKRREFFNIDATKAHTAVLSILESQAEILLLPEPLREIKKIIKSPKHKSHAYREMDLSYTEILNEFLACFNIKGRPFGQLNKPYFGMSDGNPGIQWNMTIYPGNDSVRLGVNLEGLKFQDWPIARFILSELANPSLETLKTTIHAPDKITLSFIRDAWQAASRPKILEHFIDGREYTIAQLTTQKWLELLTKAKECLDPSKNFKGRNVQNVTLAGKIVGETKIRKMEVSPHLVIHTPVSTSGIITTNIQEAKELLEPVHTWLSRLIT